MDFNWVVLAGSEFRADLMREFLPIFVICLDLQHMAVSVSIAGDLSRDLCL